MSTYSFSLSNCSSLDDFLFPKFLLSSTNSKELMSSKRSASPWLYLSSSFLELNQSSALLSPPILKKNSSLWKGLSLALLLWLLRLLRLSSSFSSDFSSFSDSSLVGTEWELMPEEPPRKNSNYNINHNYCQNYIIFYTNVNLATISISILIIRQTKSPVKQLPPKTDFFFDKIIPFCISITILKAGVKLLDKWNAVAYFY